MGSSDSSCSKTRSGLVRRKFFVDSGDGSCSRIQSGFVRRNNFMDPNASSCSRTRSGLVRCSPLAAKAPVKDELVMEVRSHEYFKEEMPSRTRSGLLRGSPTVKAISKDGPVIDEPDGLQREDMPIGTQSGLVRGSPTIKTQSKGELKRLADGWLKEDKPLGTRSGLIRRSLAVKAVGKDEPVTTEQPDRCLKEDEPIGTEGTFAFETLSKGKRAIEGLPDGWRKEYRPRKNGSSQKGDLYFIDPLSGYEFRSLKDVQRFLRTGDIKQCAIRPRKGKTYDVCITEMQQSEGKTEVEAHASTSSQHTRPATADKAIQCDILTSEGIMLPWEGIFIPYSGKNAEHKLLQKSESMKGISVRGNKAETLERNSVKPASSWRAPRQAKSVEIKKPDVQINKSKKRKTNASATPVRISPRLATLKAQHETSLESEDEPTASTITTKPSELDHELTGISLINRLQIENNNNDQSQVGQSGIMNPIHRKQESSHNQFASSQADTGNKVQALQQNGINHLHLSETDSVDYRHVNHENTANLLQSSLADSAISMQTMQGYITDQPGDTVSRIETNQKSTANKIQLSHTDVADTIIPIQTIQGCTINDSQRSNADSMYQKQANHENIDDQLLLSEAETATHVQAMQEMTKESQLSEPSIPIHVQAMQEMTKESQLSEPSTPIHVQEMQEMTKESQLSEPSTPIHRPISLENTINHSQSNVHGSPMPPAGFSWAPEQNGVPITDFWKNVENQESSVPIHLDGTPAASLPENVKFQNTAAEEPVLPTQDGLSGTAADQSGLAFSSLFGSAWSDPCIEFAFKTLTGDIPVLDDTAAVTDFFPQQQDLNKVPTPNYPASAFDKTRNSTQVDVNLPPPGPPDQLCSGSWFPPM